MPSHQTTNKSNSKQVRFTPSTKSAASSNPAIKSNIIPRVPTSTTAPCHPPPSMTRNSKSLSSRLRKLCFLVFCKLHNLTPLDLDQGAPPDSSILHEIHRLLELDFVNDISDMPEKCYREFWELLKSAIETCVNRPMEKDWEYLCTIARKFGGDKALLKVEGEMGYDGVMRVREVR